MLVVERTAPLLTIQDRGRFGYLADGVTRSGGLDPLALDVANALVGNTEAAAVLEGCLGGARFRCESDLTFALTGAEVNAQLGGAPVAAYRAQSARAGDVIDIETIARGAVWYLAIRGGIDASVVLGSRSTLVAAGLGGIDGGPLRAGATLRVTPDVAGDPARTPVPPELRTALDDSPIPLAPAPRSDILTADDWAQFYATVFTVSRAVSRTGYRLDGAPLRARVPADLASEPACAGAMQLPPEGQPIVLMADHPTIGGYPIIGVVPSYALGAFAQRGPATSVRFEAVTVAAAESAARHQRELFDRWRGE